MKSLSLILAVLMSTPAAFGAADRISCSIVGEGIQTTAVARKIFKPRDTHCCGGGVTPAHYIYESPGLSNRSESEYGEGSYWAGTANRRSPGILAISEKAPTASGPFGKLQIKIFNAQSDFEYEESRAECGEDGPTCAFNQILYNTVAQDTSFSFDEIRSGRAKRKYIAGYISDSGRAKFFPTVLSCKFIE